MTKKQSSKPEPTPTVELPAAVAEFIIKPRGLPHPKGDLKGYIRECENHLQLMLIEAMVDRVFPDRTIMVQCLGKPPEEGLADFKLPVLVQADNERQACLYAASFAHVTHYLMKGKSSHIRMRDHGDCTRGNLVVFSTDEPQKWLSTDFANVLHIAVPVNGERPTPDFTTISDVLEDRFLLPVEQTEKMWRFDMKAFIEHARGAPEERWKSILDIVFDGIMPKGKDTPCKRARHPERTKTVFHDILSDRIPKGEYLERVSTLLKCGQIILCLPQTHFFDDGHKTGHHPDTVVYDSGLTIVLKGNKPVTQEELEQCYWIGYKVSTFLASFRGLAEKLGAEVRREVTHSLTRALSHEVANAGNIIRSIIEKTELPERIKKDIQARTYLAASAARAVVAEASSKREDVDKQTSEIAGRYHEFVDFRLSVEYNAKQLSGIELPMTYELLLNEMIRNAYKHSIEDRNAVKNATLRIGIDDIGHKLLVSLSNSPETPRKLECLLDGINNPDSERLGRLRDLAALLKASIQLNNTPPIICLEVSIPIKTKS
jgi:hypothetical protein